MIPLPQWFWTVESRAVAMENRAYFILFHLQPGPLHQGWTSKIYSWGQSKTASHIFCKFLSEVVAPVIGFQLTVWRLVCHKVDERKIYKDNGIQDPVYPRVTHHTRSDFLHPWPTISSPYAMVSQGCTSEVVGAHGARADALWAPVAGGWMQWSTLATPCSIPMCRLTVVSIMPRKLKFLFINLLNLMFCL